VTVIDAATGTPVPGFSDIAVDASGFIDLSTMATTIQAIRLHVTLTGGSPVCDYKSRDTIALATPAIATTEQGQLPGPWSRNERGDAVSGRLHKIDEKAREARNSGILDADKRAFAELVGNNLRDVGGDACTSLRRQGVHVERRPVVPSRSQIGQHPVVTADEAPRLPVAGLVARTWAKRISG
jgi:hypothetical protein